MLLRRLLLRTRANRAAFLYHDGIAGKDPANGFLQLFRAFDDEYFDARLPRAKALSSTDHTGEGH